MYLSEGNVWREKKTLISGSVKIYGIDGWKN